jgi:hypothetical protein
VRDGAGPAGRIRTALFVDFDNIYLGLTRIDPDAAEVFATEPARWLAWLERGMRAAGAEDGEAAAAPSTCVLVRKCYMNPKIFHKYRPYFTRAAFEVIECPPLTAQGKTSSDIRMVMDILDALHHPTRFDEFAILSGDADFTPVLLRLRAHDRRTMVVAVGYAAAAYMAACDRVLTDDRFIEDALGIADAEGSGNGATRSSSSEGLRSDTDPPTRSARYDGLIPTVRPAPCDAAELLDQMAETVHQAVRAAGQLPARGLPRIYLRFPEFSATKDWLGFRSLRALTEELLRREPRIRLIDTDAESWHLTLVASIPAPEAPPEDRSQALRTSILRVVRAHVASSPAPVTLASASHEVLRRLGSEVVDERWGGAGSLRDLLLDAEDPGLALHEVDGVELVGDPVRHGRPDLDGETEEMPPPRADLPSAVHRVRQITGAPGLASAEYAMLFQAIGDVLATRPFHLGPTSKLVRDVLLERGQPISRVAVTFVLRGIIYGGLTLREAPRVWTARALAQAFHRNVLAMCDVAQLPLSAEERAAVERWLLGAVVAEEQVAGPGEDARAVAEDPAGHSGTAAAS